MAGVINRGFPKGFDDARPGGHDRSRHDPLSGPEGNAATSPTSPGDGAPAKRESKNTRSFGRRKSRQTTRIILALTLTLTLT